MGPRDQFSLVYVTVTIYLHYYDSLIYYIDSPALPSSGVQWGDLRSSQFRPPPHLILLSGNLPSSQIFITAPLPSRSIGPHSYMLHIIICH